MSDLEMYFRKKMSVGGAAISVFSGKGRNEVDELGISLRAVFMGIRFFLAVWPRRAPECPNPSSKPQFFTTFLEVLDSPKILFFATQVVSPKHNFLPTASVLIRIARRHYCVVKSSYDSFIIQLVTTLYVYYWAACVYFAFLSTYAPMCLLITCPSLAKYRKHKNWGWNESWGLDSGISRRAYVWKEESNPQEHRPKYPNSINPE